MNNKYHFRNISLLIWVQNSGKIVYKNIPPVKIFFFAHCLGLRDVKTFSFLESQSLVPRGPASYLCPKARIFSRRPCITVFVVKCSIYYHHIFLGAKFVQKLMTNYFYYVQLNMGFLRVQFWGLYSFFYT